MKLEKIASILNDQCKKFLLDTSYKPLYKGVDSMKGKFIKYAINKNKRNAYAEFNFTKGFNDAMKQNFKATITNSVFCIGDSMNTVCYGEYLYRIFIINSYDFTYSTKHINWLDDSDDYYSEKYDSKSKSDKYRIGFNWYKEIKNTYRNDNIVSGINSNNEILITNNDGYYSLYLNHDEDDKELNKLLKQMK